ncbi:MAG: diguanylate cyclase [Nitrospirae bacterium]|nr:MAG: diguanylate cyclase [Nitrospirota bacterium]
MRILAADDDLITRKLLQKTLEDWGYEVLVAENGRQALEIFERQNVKFIIADWMMPEIDGLSLCRMIRSVTDRGYVYFIILTARDKKEDIIEGLKIGADDYVTKPFERNELQVRVRTGERILNLEKELNEKNESLRRLNLQLEELVRMDTVMGIGNRLSFYENIEKIHHRACRYAQSYGIIMCDIDNFKLYNDTYGHLAGDNILRRVANSIRLSIRMSDEVFRYGGEEMVIIIPDQDLTSTLTVAEKVRESIEALSIEHKGSANGILTISCGAAAFDMEKLENKWEEILEDADKALYKAKAAGKNKAYS